MGTTLNVFISCAQQDEALRNELQQQLRILERSDLINIWHRGKIELGEEHEKERDVHLDQAHIILLLISQHFVDADDCYNIEMKRAMSRHDAGNARVIPVLLRPCVWQIADFARLLILPGNKKPITTWMNHSKALEEVARDILAVVKEQQKSQDDTGEKTVSKESLSNTLVRLDYTEQTMVLRQFRDGKCHVGAFLIHGAPYYGQGWLLDRLVKLLPNTSTAIDFKFSFECKTGGRSLKYLWNALAKSVGVSKSPVLNDLTLQQDVVNWQQEIVQRIYAQWQRQTVVLVLSKLHEIGIEGEQYIDKFMQEFWLPLVDMTRNQSSKHYLILFLVDNADCVDKWNLQITKQLDRTWEAHVPFQFEKLNQFSYDVLNNWVGSEDTLPANLTAQDILDNSESGIPEFVLDYVCDFFGYEWSELVKYRV